MKLQTTLKSIGAILGLATSAYATQLSFTETLSGGVAGDSATATAQFDKACAQWQADAKAMGGKGVIYTSCGTRVNYAPRTSYEEWVVSGNIRPIGSYETRYMPPFGSEARSEAKVVITVEGDYDVIEEKVDSNGDSCIPQDSGECLMARQRADAQYAKNCAAFKENAKQNLGERLIYASCGERHDSFPYGYGREGRYSFGWDSKGQIFYRK